MDLGGGVAGAGRPGRLPRDVFGVPGRDVAVTEIELLGPRIRARDFFFLLLWALFFPSYSYISHKRKQEKKKKLFR